MLQFLWHIDFVSRNTRGLTLLLPPPAGRPLRLAFWSRNPIFCTTWSSREMRCRSAASSRGNPVSTEFSASASSPALCLCHETPVCNAPRSIDKQLLVVAVSEVDSDPRGKLPFELQETRNIMWNSYCKCNCVLLRYNVFLYTGHFPNFHVARFYCCDLSA